MNNREPIIINLARLGRNGTGMWQYSLKFVECVHQAGLLKAIICEKEISKHFSQYNCDFIFTPAWVANTKKISKLRPVVWFFYSWLLALKIKKRFPGHSVVSTTHHILPLINNQTATIHDLRPYHYPDSTLQKIYFRLLLPSAVRRCEKIITVSEAVKSQIADTLNYPKHSISVVPNTVDSSEFYPDSSNRKASYFLAVGANWPHKNIDSFLIHHQTWRDSAELIIVCGKTGYYDKLRTIVESNNLNEKVKFLHDISFNELKILYANASALIYPSIDEGFGIPPIEAMASGTPAIVSELPVFREVLGDSAIYVDPQNSSSWEQALLTLSTKREKYVELGLKRAQHYSLNNMVNSVKRAFEHKLRAEKTDIHKGAA